MLFRSPGTTVTSPGDYPITISGLNNPKYTVKFVDGKLSINELPLATVAASQGICAGTMVTIGAAPGVGTRTYAWTSVPAGVAIPNQSNPSVAPLVTTTYNLVETIKATGCAAHNSTVVTVQPQLTADAGVAQEICVGGSVVIGTPGIGGNTYTWTLGDGTVVSNLANPTITPKGSEFYKLTVTKAGSCTATDGVLVNVIPMPKPAIIASPLSASVCLNNEVVYTTESGKFGYAWTWSGGTKIAGGSLTDNTVTIKWNVEGAQKVTVNYSNGPNCVVADLPGESILSISPAPGKAGVITGSKTICAPSNGNVYSVTPTAGITYVWTIIPSTGANISGQGSASITVDFDGTATTGKIYVYGKNDCRSGASDSLTFDLTQKPLAAGIITGESNFVLNSSGAYSVEPIEFATDYIWTVPSGVTVMTADNNGLNHNHVTLNFGPTAVAGSVYVVGKNDCSSGPQSPSIALTVPTKSSIIYPVPNSGIFTARISFPEETTFNIMVADPLGNIILEILDVKTSQGVFSQELNLGSVSTGLYTLLFYNDNFKKSHKIFIHK